MRRGQRPLRLRLPAHHRRHGGLPRTRGRPSLWDKRQGQRRQRAAHLPAVKNLAEAVYRRLKSDIFEFRLLPGTRFSENEVARRARVSRTPVREALFRLQREGYLEVHAKSGWSVRALDFEQLDNLYDLRVVLETAAVRKLCQDDPRRALADLAKAWLVSPPP